MSLQPLDQFGRDESSSMFVGGGFQNVEHPQADNKELEIGETFGEPPPRTEDKRM